MRFYGLCLPNLISHCECFYDLTMTKFFYMGIIIKIRYQS